MNVGRHSDIEVTHFVQMSPENELAVKMSPDDELAVKMSPDDELTVRISPVNRG